MPTTPNLAVTHIEESQANKEVTANEAFDIFDKSDNTYASVAMTDANLSLSNAQENQSGFLEFTGTLTAARTVTLRANDRRLAVYNNTTGGFALTFTDGGTSATVRSKEIALLHSDGSNVRKIAGGNFGGALDDISAFVITPEDSTITLKQNAARGFTINSLVAQLADGSCTVAIKINGVDVTGLSAVAVTTTESTTNATAANTVTAGDVITMAITNTAGSPPTSGLGIALMITYTE